jgi:hypothetical protein
LPIALSRRVPGPGGHWQWIPFLAGLASSLATWQALGATAPEFGDAADYRAAARALLAGEPYPREATQPFFRAPLYPLFLSLLWRLAPEGALALGVAQAALFASTCWLLYRIGVHVHGDEPAALAGALLYAGHPLALMQVPSTQTEVLHTALVGAGMAALSALLLSGRRANWAALGAGVAFGLAALCRPTALPIAGALAAGLVLWRRPLLGVRAGAAWRYALVMGGAAGMTILPWTLANARATGYPFLVTDAGGFHLWLGNHPDALRIYEGHFEDRREFVRFTYDHLQRDLPRLLMAQWERDGGYRALSLAERERRWRVEAWTNMRRHPGLTLRLWIDKGWALWRPWLHPAAYPRWIVVVTGLLVATLYVAAAVGATRVRRHPRGASFVCLLAVLFAAVTVVHAMVHSMVRFRLPYVDPYLCLLAGSAVMAGADGLRARYERQHGRPTPRGG